MIHDTFWFEISECSENTFDITVTRANGESFSDTEVLDTVNRLHFNILEEIQGEKLVCSIDFYEDTHTSLRWRGEYEPKLTSLRDYIWMRRRVEEAIHGDFSRFATLPRWMIDVNTCLLYFLSRVMQVVDAVFNLDRDKRYAREAYALGDPRTLLDEDEEEHREAEVIPFPRRGEDH